MWIYNQETNFEIPENALGFIYQITNLIDGRIYIGRKMLSSNRKAKLTKKDKLLPENKRKKFKRVVKETDWKDYWSSCDELKRDVQRLGQDKFKREILCFCSTKSDMTFRELYFQITKEVLFIDSYNGHVASKFFKGKVNEITTDID